MLRGRQRRIRHPLEHGAKRGGRYVSAKLMNCGQGNRDQRRVLHIIKTDNPKILGHMRAVALNGTHQNGRCVVVGTDKCVSSAAC